MIPDILVSKYLDGDLSIEEDMELRKRISEDPAAKEAFDAAILIHSAMSCADPIEVPEDTREDTLTAVFARIDSAAARPLRSPGGGGGLRMQRLMAAMVVGLFAFTIPVQDVMMHLTELRAQANVAANTDGVTVGSAESVPVRKTGRLAGATQDPAPATEAGMVPADAGTAERGSQGNTESSMATLPSIASLFTDMPSGQDGLPDQRPEYVEEPLPPSLAVVLGTYVGTGFGGSEPTVSNARIISQSVGFGVGEGLVVGLEFGSISYANDVVTTANIRRVEPGAIWTGRVPGESGRPSKLDPAPTGEYDRGSITTTSTVSRLWGTAFIQKSLLRSGVGELLVRGGVGVDDLGIIGYGRVTGQVNLQKWVSLSVGAEARTMQGILFNAVVGLQITP
mgnify:CR=1 FL=1